MQAWLLDRLGGLDQLHLRETPDPEPLPGEVILEVDFAGLNPADRYLSEGQYPARPTLPHILGRDAIGAVVAVGKNVQGIGVGERHCILRGEVGVNRAGTFAQRVAVPVESLVPAPDGWTLEEAAGATLVYLTAYQALTQWGNLPPSVVLVTGASGGVGVASIQLGRALGHTMIGLSRSAEKRQRLETLGAALTLDPHDTQWRKRVKEFLGQKRVDLAIDNVGGPQLPEVVDTLGEYGKVSVVGRLAGPVPEFNTATLFFRRLRIGGVAVGTYSNSESHAAWKEVLRLLQQTDAKPLIDHVFPFTELRAAFDRLATGPMGKVLLKVNS